MEYAFVGVSLSDATFMRSVLKLISQRDLLTIAIVDSQGTAEMKGIYLEKTHYPNISFSKPCYFLFASGNKRRL